MINKVSLLGRLGKDPETKHFDNGRAVSNFSMATTERYKNRYGEQVEKTEWHNVQMWSPIAEVAKKFLKKGDLAYVEGKLVTRQYEDRDGNTRYITEVVAKELKLMPKGNLQDSGESRTAASSQPTAGPVADGSQMPEDDLPF